VAARLMQAADDQVVVAVRRAISAVLDDHWGRG
jgi:hypothetical protein